MTDVTPAMIKAAWVEARRWWPRRIVETDKGFRVKETSILVDAPQPGFGEALKAALAMREPQP